MKPAFGIIGGSGVYEIEGLENVQWEKVESPFGEPSDELLFGELDGQRLVFLPRHMRRQRVIEDVGRCKTHPGHDEEHRSQQPVTGADHNQ